MHRRVVHRGQHVQGRTLLLAWLPISPPPTDDLAWLNAPLACNVTVIFLTI